MNWHEVPAEVLARHAKYLAFLDNEGLRFYLPAFMLNHLKTEGRIGGEELILELCLGDLERRFSMLSKEQAATVYAFLKYEELNDAYNAEEIERACIRYWSQFAK